MKSFQLATHAKHWDRGILGLTVVLFLEVCLFPRLVAPRVPVGVNGRWLLCSSTEAWSLICGQALLVIEIR